MATILGMPFLESVNPRVNWKKKSVQIKHKGKLHDVTTVPCDLHASTTQRASTPHTSIVHRNSFADLPIEQIDEKADLDTDFSCELDSIDSQLLSPPKYKASTSLGRKERVHTDTHLALNTALN
jgi:hypothetical protein